MEATDRDEAVALLPMHRPDVVTLDISIPGRSGLDVCRLIRADSRLDRTGVIAVSASVAEADAQAVGEDAFLEKPFSPRTLVATVDRLVARGA